MNSNIAESKRLLTELLSLSSLQLEQLDRESYDEMLQLIDKKSNLLTELGEVLKAVKQTGMVVGVQSTKLSASLFKQETQEVNDLLRKFQALDKYIIQQVIMHRDAVGNRVYKLLSTKSMSDSYFQKTDQSKLLDKAV